MSVLGATLVDAIIAVVLLLSAVLSWRRGFAEELVAVLAWVLGLVAAFQLAEAGAQLMPAAFDQITLDERSYGLSEFHEPVAGIVIFLVTFVLVSQLHRLLSPQGQGEGRGALARVDRLAGGLFGLLRGSALVLVLVLLAGTTAIPEADFWGQSALLPHFVDIALQVVDWLPEGWRHQFHYPPPAATVALG